MNTVIDLFGNLWNALRCVGELLGYLLRFVRVFFRSRTSLAARLLAVASQLGMCKRRIELQVCYAAAEARPVEVFVDGKNLTKCCTGVTFGAASSEQPTEFTWNSSGAKWETVRKKRSVRPL